MLDQCPQPGDGRLVIRLAGEPRGKGRHRNRMVKTAKGAFVQNYADPATAKYEGHLKLAAQQAMAGRPLLVGPLKVLILVYRAMPASLPKWQQAAALDRRLRPTTKPDWDNYAKVTDALNKVVWADDAQIVDGVVRKFYSDRPELVVVVEELAIPTRPAKPVRGKRPAEAPTLFAEAAP